MFCIVFSAVPGSLAADFHSDTSVGDTPCPRHSLTALDVICRIRDVTCPGGVCFALASDATSEHLASAGEALLEEAETFAKAKGIRNIETMIEQGRPVDIILEVSRREGVALKKVGYSQWLCGQRGRMWCASNSAISRDWLASHVSRCFDTVN